MRIPVLEVGSSLFRTFGARGLALRAVHEARRRGGWFRERPRLRPPPHPGPPAAWLVVDGDALRAAIDVDRARIRADRVLRGEYQAFAARWRPFPATPAAWHVDPATGVDWTPGTPWWRVSHLPATGDVKDVWEPARFSWAYDLVRAYVATGLEPYRFGFYALLERFVDGNPPFRGVHWSCGQETAIRATALLVAEANLPPPTHHDAVRIRTLLLQSGERIRDAVGYAVSQRNNHALSEAAGLVQLGSRFLGVVPQAAGWLRTGERLLNREVVDQFAEDGWYAQHSFTYARVALAQSLLAQGALASRNASLLPLALDRLRAATRLLLTVMEPASGVVPNHGGNDGGEAFPAGMEEYGDFRAIVTWGCARLGLPMPEDVTPHREILAWAGLPEPAARPPREDGVRWGPSGWAQAKVGRTSVFLRAGDYRFRPAHLDPLHLDVRIDGRPVVVDAGSYAYNAPPPWRNGLVGARVHNGPVVDDREPARKGPRFLWLTWPSAELHRAEFVGGRASFTAARPGAAVRRVEVAADGVTVEDRAVDGSRSLEVTWLLHPGADPAALGTEPQGAPLEASEDGVEGWYSPTYGIREAAPCVRTRVVSPGELVIRTRIGLPARGAQEVGDLGASQ